MPQFILEIFKVNAIRTKGRVLVVDQTVFKFEEQENVSGRSSLLLPQAFNLQCLDNDFLYEYPAIIYSGGRYESCIPRAWNGPLIARRLTDDIIKEFYGEL